MIYPEGAWNITSNRVVMKLFNGSVEMAIRGKAQIVPIAMENQGNTYYVNIEYYPPWGSSAIEAVKNLVSMGK